MRDAIALFQDYNRAFAERNPELLRLKVARMAVSPFTFFRGTFHVFARDILDNFYDSGPGTGGGAVELNLVGDIHTENYGTYQTEDGIHYDINDFDETTQGRFDLDVRRLATSFILAAQERGLELTDAVLVALAFLDSYVETLSRAHKKGRLLDLDVSESSPAGCPAIDQLVHAAAASKRTAFIERLTETVQGQRRLRRSAHYFNLPESERAQALRLLDDYRRRMPPPTSADFYHVEDVCGRVSGIGSMGRLRYVVMVAGKGTRDARNVLLEFKEARPSAYDLCRQRETDEQALARRAERVITVQRQSQAASNPRLGFANDGAMSFQVRELGPHDLRLDYQTLKNIADHQGVARTMAGILARTHARAAARVVGVANPLAELNEPAAFKQRILAFALAYAGLTQRDWKRFVGHRADLENCEQWAGCRPVN
jgi:uncharacterized protein (DUF2252 family)